MEDKIRVLLTEEEVNKKIKKIGEQVSKDYAGKSVHMICVLKGGVFFTCELAKRITVPVSLDFMSVSSYGSETKSSGIVKIIKDLDEPLEGKEVLIVEDSQRLPDGVKNQRRATKHGIPTIPRIIKLPIIYPPFYSLELNLITIKRLPHFH